MSRNSLGVNRVAGFGMSKRLNEGKIEFGIAPRVAEVGAGCGGDAVGGNG
jgi:hypothetical protein